MKGRVDLKFNLTTEIEIVSVIKKTKANFWENIKTGDKITLVYEMKECPSYQREYRPIIKMIKGEEIYEDSLGKVLNNMKNFEIKELGAK